MIKLKPYTSIVIEKHIPKYENLSLGTTKSRIKHTIATTTVVM